MGDVVDGLTVVGMGVLLIAVVTIPIWSWYAYKRYVNGGKADVAAGADDSREADEQGDLERHWWSAGGNGDSGVAEP